jgi:hypothetical protein
MKKALVVSVILFISCGQPQQNKPVESKKVDYIYEASYLDDFTIGHPELVLKVQEMHQHIINKDYERAGSFLSDDVVFALEDGSRLEGKEKCLQFMIEGYSSIEIQDYQVAVNLAVTGDNGDEWVLLWDNANIVSKDGTSSGFNWMETFRFVDGKIVTMNQFSKPRK